MICVCYVELSLISDRGAPDWPASRSSWGAWRLWPPHRCGFSLDVRPRPAHHFADPPTVSTDGRLLEARTKAATTYAGTVYQVYLHTFDLTFTMSSTVSVFFLACPYTTWERAAQTALMCHGCPSSDLVCACSLSRASSSALVNVAPANCTLAECRSLFPESLSRIHGGSPSSSSRLAMRRW
jgi:hypothetical protein